MQPQKELQFIECDTCKAKPGSPQLCGGCLQNRATIEKIKDAGAVKETKWIVWSIEHGAWWMPAHRGYQNREIEGEVLEDLRDTYWNRYSKIILWDTKSTE